MKNTPSKELVLSIAIAICGTAFVVGCLMSISQPPTIEESLDWDFSQNIYGAIIAFVSYILYQAISSRTK